MILKGDSNDDDKPRGGMRSLWLRLDAVKPPTFNTAARKVVVDGLIAMYLTGDILCEVKMQLLISLPRLRRYTCRVRSRNGIRPVGQKISSIQRGKPVDT